ncbi:MAG: methyltransferase domain-containing protein [Candidatus Sedimenticola endophacoides]
MEDARWDRRHGEAQGPGEVAEVLRQNLHLLPPWGRALDLACGRGANALLMARQGLRVSAWDLSPVAIERLRREAVAQGLEIEAEARDLCAGTLPEAAFDLILVSHFLERSLAPAIISALRPGGLLFYQTFSRAVVSMAGPSNSEYRLADNELLSLFTSLRVRVYREEQTLGDTTQGWRDKAMLIAQKAPAPR